MATKEWLAANKAYMQAYYRKYHLHVNKRRQARYKDRIIAWITAYKQERGCKICGEKHPACLDFHHRDPMQKKDGMTSMSALIRTGRAGMKTIRLEVAKCDVICANCHRKHHWEEREAGINWRGKKGDRVPAKFVDNEPTLFDGET